MSYRKGEHSENLSRNSGKASHLAIRGTRGRGQGRGFGNKSRHWRPSCDIDEPLPLPQYQNSWPFSAKQSRDTTFSAPTRGPSTRGYPLQKHYNSHQTHPFHGGLGFHSLTSIIQDQPGPSAPKKISKRGVSDPRLLVPVKFVKATALTDKSLEKLTDKPSEVELAQDGVGVATSNQTLAELSASQIAGSLIEPTFPLNDSLAPAPIVSDSQVQLEPEEVTDGTLKFWQSQFPGFGMTHAVGTFLQNSQASVIANSISETGNSRKLELKPHFTQEQTESVHSGSSFSSAAYIQTILKPDGLLNKEKASSDLSKYNPDGLGFNIDQLYSTLGLSSELSSPDPRSASRSLHSSEPGPLSNQLKLIPDSALEKPCASPAPETEQLSPAQPPYPVGINEKATTPIFFVDSEGDSHNLPSFSWSDSRTDFHALQNDGYQRCPSTQATAEEDEDDEEQIVFQPVPIPLREQSLPSNLHLARTISDPVAQSPKTFATGSTQAKLSTQASSSRSTRPNETKKASRAAARRRKAERKRIARQQKSGRPVGPSRSFTDIDYRQMISLREDESENDINWGDNNQLIDQNQIDLKGKSTSKSNRRTWQSKLEMDILSDYMMHTAISEPGSDDEQDQNDLESNPLKPGMGDNFLMAFLAGMDPETSNQQTIEELDEGQRANDDKILEQGAWNTDSTDSIDSDEGFKERGDNLDDLGALDSGDTENESILKATPTENQNQTNEIGKVELDSDADTESGNSGNGSTDEEELDLRILKRTSLDRATKGKGKSRQQRRSGVTSDLSDDEFIELVEELQGQWKADRARKAQKKRERAEARALNAPKSKKEYKKLSGRERKSNGSTPRKGNLDESHEEIQLLNQKIRNFIQFHPGLQSFALPPLSKKTRARFHMVAQLYGLKSHSIGKGPRRHQILEKTHRTTLFCVDEEKVQRTLLGHQFRTWGAQSAQQESESEKPHWVIPGRAQVHKKNREGAVVGQDAGHIGEDNVGFKLLSKMGWSMGQTIGVASGGIQHPIMAVVKNTKGGLGMLSGKN